MRRIFKSDTGYPITTSAGGVSRNEVSEKPFDMRKAKRVRFVDTEMDSVPAYASSRGRKATQSQISEAPKTSEYEYFRKVKNGAVHGHSCSLNKKDEQLKSSKVSYRTRGETNSNSAILNPSTKDLNCSVSGERAGPSGHNLFFSPRVSKYDEPDQILSKEQTTKTRKRSSLLSENVTPVGQSLFSPPHDEASENSENRCREKGIFFAKRERLRQWVARTSFSDVEKLHPTGSDLVSSLLSRLFPKGNKDNDSSKGDADNSCKPIISDESNYQHKELQFSNRWGKDLPKICSGKSSEIVLPERDTLITGFPFPSCESHGQDKLMDLDQNWMSRMLRNSITRHDFSFCLPFEKYRPSGLFHFKERDEYDSTIERPREEPRLLLERDTFITGFPFPSYGTESHGQDKLMDLDQHWTSHMLRNSYTRHDASFCLPFEKYRPSGSFHFKERDEFDSIIERPREEPLLLLERDTFITGFPFPSYGTESHGQDKLMDLDQHWTSHVLRNSNSQHDFSFCLPFERYRPSGSFHLKELDELDSIIERPREEPRLLLEWGSEQDTDRFNSSITNHDTAEDVYSRLIMPPNVDQQQILDSVHTKELCSPSLFSNYYREHDLLPNYGSTSCLMENFGPIFDDVKCANLSLPCTPKCITLEEDRTAEDILYNSNIIFSYRNQHWLKNKICDGKSQNDVLLECSPAAEFSVGDPPSIFHAWQFPHDENSLYPLSRQKEAPGYPFNSFSEGAFNHNLLSSNFHSSLDTRINCPLLLNHVSQDRLDQEEYFDDDDNYNLEYR